MSQTMRPGGLTALAVLNFIAGGWACVHALHRFSQLAASLMLEQGMAKIEGPAAEQARLMGELNPLLSIVDIVFLIACALTLVVSGIGYLRLKRLWGLWVGCTYCALGIVSAAFRMNSFPPALGGGLTPYILLSYYYPILTLLTITTAFRRDLSR